MCHAGRDPWAIQSFAFIADCPAIGFVLHDLHCVSVRILHVEVGVPDATLSDLRRHRDPTRGEVCPHGFGIIYLDRDMVEPVSVRRSLREQFDVLPVLILTNVRERLPSVLLSEKTSW